MAYEIIEKLKAEIEGYKEKPEWAEIGRVIEVGDGIVRILGLRNAVSQEILMIETAKGERAALALNLEEESVGALGPRRLSCDRGRRHGEAHRRNFIN